MSYYTGYYAGRHADQYGMENISHWIKKGISSNLGTLDSNMQNSAYIKNAS